VAVGESGTGTWLRRVGAAAGLGVVLVVLVLGARNREAVAQAIQWLADLGALGDLLFGLAYIAASVLLLPATLLEAGAGFVYGPMWGVPVAVALSTTSAVVNFTLGRTVLRSSVQRRIREHPQWAAVDAAVARGGLRLVGLLRVSPVVPFNVTSLVLGCSQVSLRDFVLGTAFGHLLPVVTFAYTGSTVSSALDLVDRPQLPGWVSVGVIAATAVATFGVSRMVGAALVDAGPARPPSEPPSAR
jgi:uncharacterized membrane protein YdjX (TVP38/TMEM64 family)